MDSIISPLHQNIHDEIIKRYKKTSYFSTGPYDETLFTVQVYRVAKLILKEVKADENLVLISCLLHDIGKTLLDEEKLFTGIKKDQKLWDKHPKLGVHLSKEILSNFNYDTGFIQKVCYLVENHDKRLNFQGEKSVELQILQDADYLADGGIIGILRPFLFSGRFKLNTTEQISYLMSEEGRGADDNKLNLQASKKLAKEILKEETTLKKMLKKIIS